MPMTAAEKRCATAATTASNAAFGRSTRRQAITMEIFANRLSEGESQAAAAERRRE
jgi:hypothetical protein